MTISPDNPPASMAWQADPSHPVNHPQKFSCPDPGEKPIGIQDLIIIPLPSHIGVFSLANCEKGFRRANGLHVFITVVVYSVLIVGALVMLASVITSR